MQTRINLCKSRLIIHVAFRDVYRARCYDERQSPLRYAWLRVIGWVHRYARDGQATINKLETCNII